MPVAAKRRQSKQSLPKLRLLKIMTPVFLVVTLFTTGVGAAAPATGSSNDGSRFNASQDLIWSVNGLLALDKSAQLRVTPTQAAKVLNVLKRLEGQHLIDRKPPQSGQGGQGGQGGGALQRQGQGGSTPNLSPSQQQEFRRRRQQREKEIQAAVDEIDKILTTKQVEFIDNIDFDPAPYSMRVTGGQRGLNGFGNGQPSQQQLQELRKRSQEVRGRIAKLYDDTMTYLEKRAKAKK
jgi:hypothetical protein